MPKCGAVAFILPYCSTVAKI
jgi:hypothetical protein